MAVNYSYNTYESALLQLYLATGGGIVFSGNLYNSSVFDYFDNNAVVDDAIYFGFGYYYAGFSDLLLNVGTAIIADSIVFIWEYYSQIVGWTEIEDLIDDTNGFTTLGANRVRFPLQWQPVFTVINGLNKYWVRCRIVSVTNITEGGANQTNVIRRSNGELQVMGGTDDIPATFSGIYDWIIANLSYISVSKRNDSSYNFTKVALYLSSRTKSYNEVIELGQDSAGNATVGRNRLHYLESGRKINDRGYDGSVFIVYGVPNTSVIDFSRFTKLYGTVFKAGKRLADARKYPGYCNPYGDLVDNIFELALKVPAAGYPVIRTKAVLGLLIASYYAMEEFDNLFVITTSTVLFYVYRGGFELNEFGYEFISGSGMLFYLYQASEDVSPEFILLNPQSPIPSFVDDVKPIQMSSWITDFPSVKFYDVGLDQYIDYTVEAGDLNPNDFPLSGNVGDILYFGMDDIGTRSGGGISLTKDTQDNSYIYEWEYYKDGSWHSVLEEYIWDDTDNLGKSGRMFLAIPWSLTQLEIDGYTGYWLRARITGLGIGDIIGTELRQFHGSGISGWKLYEKFTFDVLVTDKDGNNIENAQVKLMDQNGNELFVVTTKSNGAIDQQKVITKKFMIDPSVEIYYISEELFTEFSININKSGYQIYIGAFTIDKKIDMEIALAEPRETIIQKMFPDRIEIRGVGDKMNYGK